MEMDMKEMLVSQIHLAEGYCACSKCQSETVEKLRNHQHNSTLNHKPAHPQNQQHLNKVVDPTKLETALSEIKSMLAELKSIKTVCCNNCPNCIPATNSAPASAPVMKAG